MTVDILQCRCCNTTKSIKDFVKDKYSPTGYKRLCKRCNSDKMIAWHKANPAKSRKALYFWRTKNRQYWLDYLQYLKGKKPDFQPKEKDKGLTREEARIRMKEIKSEYDKNHKEEARQYRQLNKERLNQQTCAYKRNKALSDPSYKMATVLRSRFGNLLRKVKAKHFSSKKALELLGCDIPFFLRWIERNFEQGMTWQNHGNGDGKWHIDHNLPCASFDLTDPEQQKQCFHWTNLFPLWAKHNLDKRANIWVLDYQI